MYIIFHAKERSSYFVPGQWVWASPCSGTIFIFRERPIVRIDERSPTFFGNAKLQQSFQWARNLGLPTVHTSRFVAILISPYCCNGCENWSASGFRSLKNDRFGSQAAAHCVKWSAMLDPACEAKKAWTTQPVTPIR